MITILLKIPMFGWISTNNVTCAKCKKPIGHFVDGMNTENNSAFHTECFMDYIAEREGWTRERDRYTAVQRKYNVI